MIRISDNSLAEYFSSIQAGQELSRDEVSKHLALYSFDFAGVTGQHDLEKFTVTSPGQITQKAGLVQSRIKLSPVFANPGLENRSQLASEFHESIATQAYNRSKIAIEMEMFRQKGVNFKTDVRSIYQMSFNIASNGDVSLPEDFRPSFSLKKGGENVRLTLPEATQSALEGTDLFNEIYSEVLLGSKEGLKYDKQTRTFIQANRIEESELRVAPNGKYVPRKDDITFNETNFSEKLDRMLNQMSSMDRDLEDVEDVINTLQFEDASRIESLSEKQILKEYDGVRKMIQEMSVPSAQDETNIRSEVDKRLGVDAKQEAKDRLVNELMEKKKKELELENTKAFKDNVKMYVADRRDYLSSDNRKVGIDEQLDDMYKESYAIKKAEEQKEKYINRVRAATHTQQEDGSWVRNDRLPNRVADRTRQAIAIDMNPASAPDPLSASLIGTVRLGEQNLVDAQNSIQSEMDSLKEKRKALSRAYDEQPKGVEVRKSSYIIGLEADVERQKALVSRLQNIIQNDGYEKEFGKTIFNKKDGWLEQVGISKEMYDQYRANPEKLIHDITNVTAESAFNRERSKVANRESWYRALGNEQIVKGHYNDERGYRITEINPETNIAYLSRPSMKVSELYYSADIENKELLQNIDLAEQALMTRYNPSNAVVSDYDVAIGNFNNDAREYVTVFSEIPTLEYIEPEVTDQELARSRQAITNYINKGGNVRYDTFPQWLTSQLDQYIQEHEMQRISILDDIEIAKESLASAKKKGVSIEKLKLEQERLKAEQDRLSEFSKQQNAIRNSITEQVLGEIKDNRINDIIKRNDRISREIELFGFKQGVDNSRVELSADNMTRIIIGNEKGTTAFYRKIIDGHLPHLKNEKGNGTGSVAAAALEVIADHVSQKTEFDLRDEAMARKYMQRLNSDALTPADLGEEHQGQLNKYIKSLPEKGLNERLRDTLFTEILHKTMEIEYGAKDAEFSGMSNTVKSIYDEMRSYYPEADITGQSMHSYIHNKENGVYKELKRTYQSKTLSLSPNMLDSLLSQYRTMGDVSLDALTEIGREAADAAEETVKIGIERAAKKAMTDEILTAYDDDFFAEDYGARSLMSVDSSQYDKLSEYDDLIDIDIDKSDLKKTDLTQKNWEKLIEDYPHMQQVKDLHKRALIKYKRTQEPQYKEKGARLSLYAMGALNNQEAKYQKVLRLEDSIDIFDGENLLNKALSNPETLSERQLSTALELADSLGKKVNVKIPIGDGQFSDGFLRFNEANEIEAYSPALNQAYLVNDTGNSKIATVRMDDMRAYGTDNRLNAAQSYSKQQPILRQSIANEGQMKRKGMSTVISNIDASFGELVDFAEQGKVGMSYDIETTMTNPQKLKGVVQPIEIFAQQLQMNRETGGLYRDEAGRFAVMDDVMEEVVDADGTTRMVQSRGLAAKEFHAIMALERPAIDLINKIALDDDYFNISQSEHRKVHIMDYINARDSRPDTISNADFVQRLLGTKTGKKKANKIMNELATKAEEFQFINNVAKYRFGANKSDDAIERFRKYSLAEAVDTTSGFISHLKDTNREKYNELFHSNGIFKKGNEVQFGRLLYQHQAEQTKTLVADAVQASKNLADKSFDYGENVLRVSAREGLEQFEGFYRGSDVEVIFGQNVEKADNKTLVDTARLIDERAELNKVIDARDALFQEQIGVLAGDRVDKFGINPNTAIDQRKKTARALEEEIDIDSYIDSRNKVWVGSLAETLDYLPNAGEVSEAFNEADARIASYNSMIDKLTTRSADFSDEEMTLAKELNLFGGEDFSIKNKKLIVPTVTKTMDEMFKGLGVVDQQAISRIMNPELRSQSNAALMDAFNHDKSLAHDGKVDTIFGSQNVERFTQDLFDHMNNPEGGTSPLSYIMRSLDTGSVEDGSFMERNSYRGDGTEHISFIERPNDDIQKGVYRLLGFNKSGTEATLQRVVQGSEGVIDDTSIAPVTLKGQTNAELAHKFSQSARYVPGESVSTEIANYTQDITRRHFDKILASNLSYDSHMNQIREMEIESGAFSQFKTNPLFAIDDKPKSTNLLNASMEELIEATGNKGTINLQSNPVERARQMFADSVTPMEELRKIIDNDATITVSDVDRSLIRNTDLLQDQSKEKFYNKEMTKEQVRALQDINDFNHTELGVRLSDLMDNVTALESQGHVSAAEKADILSRWNEAIKEKAAASDSTYKVRDTAVLPSFMVNIKDEAGEVKGVPIQSNIQVSSPTEVANSLQKIASKIGDLREYSSAKGMVGLKEDYALNAEVVPHLKNLGVLNASDIEIEPGKNRFIGLGELSHMVYNNLQKNPDLLERSTAIDYLSLAKNMSEEDLSFMDAKSEELLGKYFARQTEVQALQFDGLIESRQMLRNEGLYIPGMKLEAGQYSLEDVEDLKQYSTSSFLGQRSTSELVSMADRMAGSGTSADKERTKLIYREIMNRAATDDDGKKNIDPKAIIESGSHRRIEAASAMGWIKPVTQRSSSMYVPNENIVEHRLGYGQFAGARLGDIPESALDNQSYMAYKNMSLPSYEQRYGKMPHLQQQEMIANWRETGYDGHDHSVDNKFYTARGERPIPAENLAAQNEQIKEEFGNTRRNETPGSLSAESLEEMVSRARKENPTESFANNENIASRLNIHPAVSEEEVQIKSAERAQIEKPTGHHSSPISDYITNQKANLKDEFGSLLEGGNGAKWVAGLGVAAAALYAVNAINSPMKLETRPAGHGVQGVTGTPEDDTDRPNRQAESRESLGAPNVQTGGTSYVTSGEKGYTIKASGKAPSNIDSSQLQSTINNSMTGANGVNINLRDDRSILDGSWLETQFSNFIERGSVGG